MIITLSNPSLTAQIKLLGAELCSLKDNTDKEYIWNGNPAYWGKHSPILFPIVGSLKENSYQYGNSSYKLPRHGFARDMEFELIDKKPDSATFSLKANAETKEKYPFDFELQLIYTLESQSLKIEYKVLNPGKSQLPFSIGAHPAFALEGNFEDYSLIFEKEENLEYYTLEEGLISNSTAELKLNKNILKLSRQLFEKDALVFKNTSSRTIAISKNAKPFLKVSYADFPDLGIWTAPSAPFICIEPWFGYADTLTANGNITDKEGILLLDRNELFQAAFKIEIL